MLSAAQHAYEDFDALQDDYHRRGWTDGLPVVPPVPERVERFLAVAGLDPAAVLGSVPTRDATVTAELVAINAVMAGCAPEYMPVVVAAVRAHLNEMANCHSTTGTLSGAAQIVVVNGPVRTEIGVHGGAGCFGPGWRAQRDHRTRAPVGDPQRLSRDPRGLRPGLVLDAGALRVLLR